MGGGARVQLTCGPFLEECCAEPPSMALGHGHEPFRSIDDIPWMWVLILSCARTPIIVWRSGATGLRGQMVFLQVCCGGCCHCSVLHQGLTCLRQALGIWWRLQFCHCCAFVFDLNPHRASLTGALPCQWLCFQVAGGLCLVLCWPWQIKPLWSTTNLPSMHFVACLGLMLLSQYTWQWCQNTQGLCTKPGEFAHCVPKLHPGVVEM